ncbi:MAG: tRNA (N6-isopentenyl adenosine(37)-C2)-methylthiotransferase MiaB, partial [Chloroflexi bacterium]|nr:tRNA (N6-isopentenyl adenosine(37)-C2)-methylthiotransferase MiaB [Chloroflexota bacterium]
MNKEDSARMAAALEQAGLTEAAEADQADVVVVNSCSVRASAEEHVAGQLGWLKGLKRQRPELVITLAGCMVGPDTERALRNRFPFIDVFLRPSQVRPLLAFVQQRGMVAGEGCLPII